MDMNWQAPETFGWGDFAVALPTGLFMIALCLSVFGFGARIGRLVFYKGAPLFLAVVIGVVAVGVVAPLLGIGFGIVASGSSPLIRLALAAVVTAAAWLFVYLDRIVLLGVQLRRHRRAVTAADAAV